MEDLEVTTVSDSIHNAAVRITNAHKSYTSSSIVFKGLNLTVRQGTIYGLLGSSGCGKTTLLNCIVGRLELDSGNIQVAVKKRREIGFMPQELCLHQIFTISETFHLYGYLFGMTNETIEARSVYLIKLFNLPPQHRCIRTLSGGEQRRVSVAVTLLHDPKILILDEPTVGLDPILSESIWQTLLEMAQKGKTIIITTHYIQEARHAHMVGLMRGGVLLAEEDPRKLMDAYHCDDLEAVFLELSYKQESTISKDPEEPDSSTETSSPPMKVCFVDDNTVFSKVRFKGIMYKNITMLKREFIFLIFVILLPLIQTYLFNYAVGRKPKYLPLGVVNEEIPSADCNEDSYKGCFLDSNRSISLSCMYLEYLQNHTYELVSYENSKDALIDMEKNKVWGVLHFTKNYTSALANRVKDRKYTFDSDIDAGTIDSWIDSSNQYLSTIIKYDIVQAMLMFLRQTLTNCEINPKSATVPISFEQPVFGSYDESFVSYTSTAMMILCSFFLPTLLTGGLVHPEKSGGMIERITVTGVTVIEIISSVITIQLTVHVVQTMLSLIVMYLVFDNRMDGSIFTLTCLLMVTGCAGMFFGLMMALVSESLSVAAFVSVCICNILTYTCGMVWPTEAGHYLLRSVNWLVPLTWTVEAARSISSRSFDIFHIVVLRGFASMIAWNLIFICVVYYVIKSKKDVWAARK